MSLYIRSSSLFYPLIIYSYLNASLVSDLHSSRKRRKSVRKDNLTFNRKSQILIEIFCLRSCRASLWEQTWTKCVLLRQKFETLHCIVAIVACDRNILNAFSAIYLKMIIKDRWSAVKNAFPYFLSTVIMCNVF